MYRLIDLEAPVIEWKKVMSANHFDIELPFDIHKYVVIPKRSIIVIGGVSNSGKSAFVHNIFNLNWRKYPVWLWDSEHSKEELRDRLRVFPDYDKWPQEQFRERTKNFADVIAHYNPDGLNLIDYLDVTFLDNYSYIGRIIREIHDALGQGVVAINIQMAKGADLPIGQQFTIHLARLLLTIDPGILTIKKAKQPRQRNINPTNMKWSFKIDETGENFKDIKPTWENI